MSKPVSVLCVYRVKKGKEAEFQQLLARHWPTLNKVGLAGPEPVKVVRSQDRDGRTVFIETFQWKDEQAAHIAHQTPEVMQVWEPMGPLADDMDFFHVEPVRL